MFCRAAVWLLLVACGSAPAAERTPDPTRVELQPGDVTFVGMCDASGAVPLDGSKFVVADDEDTILRTYDVKGGAPIAMLDVTDAIIPPTARAEVLPTDEVDIEAATRVGNVAFWIASHARRKGGKPAPARLRFFATNTPSGDEPMRVLGTTDRLLAAMISEPKFAHLPLAKAAITGPTEDGGLNIEGLSARREGGVWIAFRNPVVGGKALVIGLENPLELIQGGPAKFVAPVLLDLDGLGIRAMTQYRGRYAVVAGHPIHARRSVLHVWKGTRANPRAMKKLDLTQFNAEAFVARDDRDRIMLLSDDGTVMIDGKECKRLADPAMKQFHGRWVALPN
ncbi:MAG: DUF3616 domain-containing protein [Deltaproteobacteria bacterium]|nr:DUF3616 domain-containing protein [Deltaproteobacteria bacterium]